MPDFSGLLGYLDPGSGSLIVQAVIATLVAVPFFFRQQIGRAVRRFRGGMDPTAAVLADSTRPTRDRDA